MKPGNYMRPYGEHMHTGDVVLKAGTEITPGVIGVLATVKAAQFCRVSPSARGHPFHR